MNTSDRIFKLQGQLATWSGTKKVAGWLAIVAVGVSAVGAIFIGGEERKIGALAATLPTVIVCLLLRSQAKQKIGEIEAELSS